MTDLRALARHHGLTTDYPDLADDFRQVPDYTLCQILERLGVDPEGPITGEPARQDMAVPGDALCFVPDWLENAPAWGIFCQLYELRSARNHGIGDFRDLADLARVAGAAGADFLGVSPLHALFSANPAQCSPYSPSSRLFLNPVYIALDDVPGFDPADIAPPDDGDLVDYETVVPAKLAALRKTFARLSDLPAEFDHFCAKGGVALDRHALFESLSAHMVAEGHAAGWMTWPEAFRDPEGAEVAAFAKVHGDDLRFHKWLQWIAAAQLKAAMQACRSSGMRIGLYLDVAVGEAPDGSTAWSSRDVQMPGLSIGAPPDMFAVDGQNWGLSAPSPAALRALDFAPYRQLIAAQMRHVGALRIDHAMALWQLFLIPHGELASAGAHLRYPMADLIRVWADESRRHRVLIVGEDLGFVPDGFREAMQAANILSYRILYFEQHDGAFLPPDDYPKEALACLSTHDLPVLERWWTGDDIALRRSHALVGAEASDAQLAARDHEKLALAQAMIAARVLDHLPQLDEPLSDALLVAAYRFLARSPAFLVGVRLADLVGPKDPTNLPGTVNTYPNWRHRSPVRIEDIAADPCFAAVAQAMRHERPRQP